ncbi:hypothetical protein [Massilia genomosp. 1]|uniref:Uncharacterized protein n=1 Tax=Massilia genomosp. 1 TaxID=2609280 RepID=A0ABX0MNK8_9BURK|nr:hypothetical protein [Massilia genomosp. 1]NHZ61520.1 hypothetical protein [Massilia genomosp. 1]
MNVTIEEIDSASMRPIGSSPQPSFVVHFRSAAFSGIARLVPALERAEDCLGQEFNVEICQGSVTQFGVLDQPALNAVEAQDTPGSFKVTGIVESQSADPGAQRYGFITAGEACFCLSEAEMGGLWPEPESIVSFIAHDVTLWDEAL